MTVKFKNLILSFFSVIAFSLFPCFFLFFHNSGTATFNEFIGIASIIALISIIILFFYFFLIRNFARAALVTSITMGFLLYFAYIEKAISNILPALYYWHVALICLFLIAHIVFFIQKKMSSKIAAQINAAVLYIFAGLILFNGILAIQTSLQSAKQKSESSPQPVQVQVDPQVRVDSANLPNVYFFIFDEYSGLDGVKRYCDYDNTPFYDALEHLGFVTSKHSVNETIETITEIPNLLQLSRVNTIEMSTVEKRANFKNPFLLRFMKATGYTINGLDSTNYEFLDKTLTDTHLTTAYISTYGTFNSYIIQNTAYYPFYGSDDHIYEIKRIGRMFDYAIESSQIAETNVFTVGYFSFPHFPYIFDENGNRTNDADRLNLGDPNAYLGQFKYANKKILEMVTEILKNDPNSIIILQSDHGYRLASHLHFWYGIDKYEDLAAEAPYERNILNAVYFRGEALDIEGLSGLDTVQLVLDKLLGTEFRLDN